jgi:uncharacterized protein (DUF849 family)
VLAVSADLVLQADLAGGDPYEGIHQHGDGYLRRVLGQQVDVVVIPVALRLAGAEVTSGFGEHVRQVDGVVSDERATPVFGHEDQVSVEGGDHASAAAGTSLECGMSSAAGTPAHQGGGDVNNHTPAGPAPGPAAGAAPGAAAKATGPGTLITVAPTGAESQKSAVPALPVTLEELVTTAKECQAAGAAVIHVHIRDRQAQPTLELARLTDTVAALRESTDLIVQLSTGGAVTDGFEARLAVLDAAPDACSLTCGTVNFGDEVFSNPWPFIRDLYTRTKERGVVPEFELFDLGHVATLHRLLGDLGAPHGGHVHCDLVMGVPGGMPGNAATLVQAVSALPPGATWSATGIGRTSLPVMFAALSAGGHLRVGMEDTVSFARGRPVTGNAELVERAAALAELAQRPAMRPDQARALLGVSGRR